MCHALLPHKLFQVAFPVFLAFVAPGAHEEVVAVGVFREQVLTGGLVGAEVVGGEYCQVFVLPLFSVADEAVGFHNGADALGVGGGVEGAVFAAEVLAVVGVQLLVDP